MIESFSFDKRTGLVVPAKSLAKADWIRLGLPTVAEMEFVEEEFGIPLSFAKAALDEDEHPRIETENGLTLILVKVPRPAPVEMESSTIPLAFILSKDKVFTVSLRKTGIFDTVLKKRPYLLAKKKGLVIKALSVIGKEFNKRLDRIDKEVDRLENDVRFALKNKEVIRLLKIQKELVYFNKALIANKKILERIDGGHVFSVDKAEDEILEDAISEINQALDETAIYSSILSNTMDAYVSIISNNLNEVMKLLTIVTILISIPATFFNFFGMNLLIPLANSPGGAMMVLAISCALALASLVYFRKRGWV
ncbi:MAG: magnesium transporter CorA family protein [archaeon]